MISNTFITTKNVNNADDLLGQLISRPKDDVPGLAVFFGRPGLGKTTWAINKAQNNENYFYVRLKSADTTRSFLIRLSALLTNGNYKLRDKINISNIYEDIEEILLANPQYVIFFDEVDLAFERSYRVLKLLRDLADTTQATFVLIGMENLKSKIKNYSNHYFDRCYFNFEFDVVSPEETKVLIDTKLGIKSSDTLAKRVWQKSQGTLRKTIKAIAEMEKALLENATLGE